ncbi:ParA family protein [Mumia sp. DW29H23]|uniref:ParA family protein n=1 Tax=Mumia sp. DW29H23 TaxID=3421241 RepID=UPI003D697469
MTPHTSDTPSGPRILAVANQKGGVAKTTTVASLGAALAQRGRQVLLVDLDPQSSLTFSLGVDPEELDISIREVLLGEKAPQDVIVVTDEAVHLLPATIELAQAEETLASMTGREQRLRVALEQVADDYDWILLDCPPSLGVLTAAALTAATDLLVPLQCETLAHRGVGQLLDTVHDVRTYTNPDLTVLGVLPTAYDGRTRHARAVLEAITESYGLEVVEPPIPRTVRFAEAPAYGRSILRTAASHRGALAYREVADRLLAGD